MLFSPKHVAGEKAMLKDLYAGLRAAGRPRVDQALEIELVFAEARTEDALREALVALLPESDPDVESAFGEDLDRFLFVSFPEIRATGQEAEVFAFARALRPAIGAEQANPVLDDSLYGAMAVGAADDESFLVSCETPRNSDLAFGWVHPVIDTIGAWSHTRGAGAMVAVIDTGHSSHQELLGSIRSTGQLNLVEGGSDARDRFSSGFMSNPGHGTLVCSVVAARGTADAAGNTGGPGAVTGAAPDATVLPIRAIRSVVSFRQRTLPRAIAHAANQGADVIAMALGGPTRVAATERALRDAMGAGVVIICAAGNCWPRVVFPAAYAANGLCTAVAALTHTLAPWDKTGRGPEVTLSAPGENVWGAAKNSANDPDNGIRASQGTTLATSLTAGVAALWCARHGGRSALFQDAQAAGTTVQAMWTRCATEGLQRPALWGSAHLGAGVLNAGAALQASLPTAATGLEAVAEANLPPGGVETTANIYQTHLANHDPDALPEFTAELADFAPELLWRSHRVAAKSRAAVSLGDEAVITPDRPSPELARMLADRPALRAAAGLF